MQLAALVLAAALTGSPAPGSTAGDVVMPAFEGGPQNVDVVSTAYTSGPESTGKRPGHPQYGITFTGTKPRSGGYGTIAVDPQQIPLGSLVYIAELHQYRVAEDVGGAIRGKRIDLYMDQVSEAVNWGVRPVQIRVFPKI